MILHITDFQSFSLFCGMESLYLINEKLFNQKTTHMSVLKVIEVLSDSDKSWEDAARQAVKKASSSVDNIKSVYINEQSATIKDGEIVAYRVNVKITFAIK